MLFMVKINRALAKDILLILAAHFHCIQRYERGSVIYLPQVK